MQSRGSFCLGHIYTNLINEGCVVVGTPEGVFVCLINEGCVIAGTERKELTHLNVVCLDGICVMHFPKSTFREEENWWCLVLYVV